MQNSSGSNRYELTENTLGVREYTLRVPESTNVVYVRPQLRDDVQDAVITAYFTDVNSGEEKAVELPVDEVTSLTSSTTGRLLKAYNIDPKELTLEVKEGDRTEVHHIRVVRGSYLGGFTLTDDTGNSISYTPEFQKTKFQYGLHVPSSMKQLHISMTGAEKTSTCLKVNGELAENGQYTLPLEVGTVTAVLEAGDGNLSSPYEYTLTISVDEICYVTVNTDPEDAVCAIYDADKIQIDAKEGVYELIKGQTYSYTVSAAGYQTLSGTFKVQGDETKLFTMEKSAENEQEAVEAEWGGYWKTEDNLNIVDAPMPSSLASAEVFWKQQYGSYGDYTNSVSDGILVEDKICCFQGAYLMYLNRETGEVVKQVKMVSKGNSGFTKPLYAAGIIFVPLTGGRVQAFRATTLESLWVYTDIVGGNAATALRYDSGYLYAGFADGNLVCLTINDENPNQSDEEKTAVWRKYDSGGYYRTGMYTGVDYLYVCGRSGNLYCLNKKTGETVQTITLPQGAGAASTAICQNQGRIYFATENGYLCSYPLTESGKIQVDGVESIKIDGTIYGTPVIYKNRLYVGSAGKDTYGTVHSPYHINTIQIAADGKMSLAYRMEIKGCPKGSGTLTTAYEATDGYVYVYFTTDTSKGSIYLLKDKEGLTEPGEGSGLFYQQIEVYGNGSGSILADTNGTMYFRYESGWMYAIKASGVYLENITIDRGNPVIDGGEDFSGQAENHEILLDAGVSEFVMGFQTEEDVMVSVNGTEGNLQTIKLTDGKAQLKVVLSKNGQTRTYHFQIQTRSSDASLRVLQTSLSSIVSVLEMELSPVFDKEILEYNSSIYGTADKDKESGYYVWPIASNSKAKVKVFVVSGVKNAVEGDEIEPANAAFGDQVRERYKIIAKKYDETAKIRIQVTAEDGVTKRDYYLNLFHDDTVPDLTVGSNPIVERGKDSVTLKINTNMEEYLYYLATDEGVYTGLPAANEVRKQGERMAVSKGSQTVTISGLSTGKQMLYLYGMSYAQRFTNGIRIEIPEYKEKPSDPVIIGTGDVNQDGTVDMIDVVVLQDAVTAGTTLDLKTADMNGDDIVDMIDVVVLQDAVTAGTL